MKLVSALILAASTLAGFAQTNRTVSQLPATASIAATDSFLVSTGAVGSASTRLVTASNLLASLAALTNWPVSMNTNGFIQLGDLSTYMAGTTNSLASTNLLNNTANNLTLGYLNLFYSNGLATTNMVNMAINLLASTNWVNQQLAGFSAGTNAVTSGVSNWVAQTATNAATTATNSLPPLWTNTVSVAIAAASGTNGATLTAAVTNQWRADSTNAASTATNNASLARQADVLAATNNASLARQADVLASTNTASLARLGTAQTWTAPQTFGMVTGTSLTVSSVIGMTPGMAGAQPTNGNLTTLSTGNGSGLTYVQLLDTNSLAPSHIDPFPTIVPTPPLMFNAWFEYQGVPLVSGSLCSNFVAAIAASGIVTNYPGEVYFDIDDGWESDSRGTNGVLMPSTNFNSSIRDFTNCITYAHQNGIKFRIYTAWVPTNGSTCMGYPGTDNAHMLSDLLLWKSWGVDGIKIDSSCNGGENLHQASREVEMIRRWTQAFNSAGSPLEVDMNILYGDASSLPTLELSSACDDLLLWQPGDGYAPYIFPAGPAVSWVTNVLQPFFVSSNTYAALTRQGHYFGVSGFVPAANTLLGIELNEAICSMFNLQQQIGYHTNSTLYSTLKNQVVQRVQKDKSFAFPVNVYNDNFLNIITKKLDDGSLAVLAINTNSVATNKFLTFDLLGLPTNSTTFYFWNDAFGGTTAVYTNGLSWNFGQGAISQDSTAFMFATIRPVQLQVDPCYLQLMTPFNGVPSFTASGQQTPTPFFREGWWNFQTTPSDLSQLTWKPAVGIGTGYSNGIAFYNFQAGANHAGNISWYCYRFPNSGRTAEYYNVVPYVFTNGMNTFSHQLNWINDSDDRRVTISWVTDTNTTDALYLVNATAWWFK